MPLLSLSVLVVAASSLLLSAAHDFAVRTVPNSLALSIGICGAVLAVLEHRLLPSLAVAALILLLAAGLWLRGYMGGADAKLFAAAGLLVAPGSVPAMLFATAFAGGFLCLPYLPGRALFARPAAGRPKSFLRRVLRCERWRLRRRGPLPYAAAIAAGTLFAMFGGA